MGTRVVVLEDDDDLRETMAEFLGLSTGADCVGAASVADLKAHSTDVLNSNLALLDINLGANEPSGIDAYRWLRENGYTGRIVFLTGHAGGHPLVDEARRVGGAALLIKPVPFNSLTALVLEASP
jgi:response regulator of citrate/malate metabolism